MQKSFRDFDSRVHRLNQKAAAMANGYQAKLRRDGLIELAPRRPSLIGRLPWKHIAFVAVSAVLYKGWLLYSLGAETYGNTVTHLSAGEGVEKVGAFLMQIDPATRVVAQLMGHALG